MARYKELSAKASQLHGERMERIRSMRRDRDKWMSERGLSTGREQDRPPPPIMQPLGGPPAPLATAAFTDDSVASGEPATRPPRRSTRPTQKPKETYDAGKWKTGHGIPFGHGVPFYMRPLRAEWGWQGTQVGYDPTGLSLIQSVFSS